jgi:invasion protein IalB
MRFLCTSPGPARHLARAAACAALLGVFALPANAQTQPAAPAKPAAAAAGTAQPDVQQPDWEKVCGTVNKAQECHVSRRRIAATGQAIAQFLVIERDNKKLLQIAVPPVALIQPGIQVKVDDGDPTGVKYVVCTPGECLALGEINDDFIGKLKKGSNVVITMLDPQGKPVSFPISLSGFTASYDGPAIDPQEAKAKQQKLEDELKKKADQARQQLMQLQQQQQPAASSTQ